MNEIGQMGLDAYGASGIPGFTSQTLGCEYPTESLVEHVWGLGILIGALHDTGTPGQSKIAKGVISTEIQPLLEVDANEVLPVDIYHPWYHTSTLNLNEANRRSIDDDDDGKMDEDELDGIDNDHDGKIDEDYAAVSESDYYCGYTDSFYIFNRRIVNPHPLGVKIWQRSYAWAREVREPLLPIEYYLVNVGRKKLDSVYIGFHIWPSVGPLSTGISQARNFAGYWPELRTAYVDNPIDKGSTPIGFTILETGNVLTGMKFFFKYWPFSAGSWFNILDDQSDLYDYLGGELFPSDPAIQSNQSLANLGLNYVQFSFGPFKTWDVGETLKVSLSVVGGHSLKYGADNLYNNARFVQSLYNRHLTPPVILPAPRLSFNYGENKVALRWSPSATAKNPEDYWDDGNSLAPFYPPEHWRRRNPPPGSTTGGRVFEGYRLYRSDDPAGTANSFTLLKQWDIIDSVGPRYGYDTGIETTYVDSNLHTNKTYWYSVTSFGIPDLHVIDYVDFDGTVKQETLNTPSAETSVLASRKRVNLPFAPNLSRDEPDKVLVVPNPYRVDETYTLEAGGWEGRGKTWNENKRLIKFIHLPPKCTIRIYSLVGDVIATLNHDDPNRGEIDWNLLSESNRAIASGVYVFSVESEYGTQIGKFAVIR